MAYTIKKSNGTTLTTIADGTINTTSTSLGLPGRNYAGYGNTLDTNFVHQLENFANTAPPANPLTGQLWYNTNSNTLYVCPTDGLTDANAWVTLATTSANSTTTFGAVQVTGNVTANNITANNTVTGATGAFTNISVTSTANIASGTANIGTGNITSLFTNSISTSSQANNGTLTGVWTANGAGTANSVAGTSMWVTGGNLMVSSSGAYNFGLKIANANCIMDFSGNPITFSGSYNDSNVAAYLPVFGGNILANTVTATRISGRAQPSVTAGSFVVGQVYIIATIGTTDFTLIGAASNTSGVQFTATGIGTGTGTAYSLSAVAATALVAGYSYQIATVGSGTNWTSIGASSGAVGVQFTATSAGTGSGTAYPINSFSGIWALSAGSRLTATYADLAERFEADAYYDAGTVVELGGNNEITAVQYELSDEVFGVVSDTAAYLMNAGAGNDITHPPIAVGGRVKVKVTGKVKKGQRLVSAGNGMARAANAGEATSFNVIGRALENKTTDDLGAVEAFVKIN
jgi:hypothetical protein